MRSPARSSLIAWARYVTAPSKIRSIVPPASTFSLPRSFSGTRAILRPRLPKLALPLPRTSSGMLLHWPASTSASPATISGTPVNNSLTAGYGPCGREFPCWRHELAYPGVQKSHFYAVTPIREHGGAVNSEGWSRIRKRCGRRAGNEFARSGLNVVVTDSQETGRGGLVTDLQGFWRKR